MFYYARRTFERVSEPQHPGNSLRRGGSFVELERSLAELIQYLARFDAKVLIWITRHRCRLPVASDPATYSAEA
jgi:hypothetical protein